VMRRARERAASPRKLSPQALYDSLLRGAGVDVVEHRMRDQIVKGANGKALFRIAFRAKTLHVILQRTQLAPEVLDEITRNIVEALEQCDGRVLARQSQPSRSVRRPKSGLTELPSSQFSAS
jgi:hypothetical protein